MAKVFITGIAGGFGLPTARALMSQGHEVAGSLRSRNGRKAATVAALAAEGAHIVAMGVCNTASTGAGVGEAMTGLGRLDVMFNNP